MHFVPIKKNVDKFVTLTFHFLKLEGINKTTLKKNIVSVLINFLQLVHLPHPHHATKLLDGRWCV